jgi:hypothetical protein
MPIIPKIVSKVFFYLFEYLAPIKLTRATSVVEIKIIIIPRAESLPHRPSLAKRRI